MVMTISEDTLAVVEYLNEYSNNSLRKGNDVEVILELAAQSGDADIINNIVFAGSSLWKLFGVMKKTSPSSDGYNKLEEEFASSMNALRSELASLAEQAPEEVLLRFDTTYFGMSQGVVRNLTDLSHDLSRFKEMQNEARRSKNK
jgi:hypothetical protein